MVLAYFTSRVVWLPRWPPGGSRGFPDGFQVGSEASRMTLLVPLDDSSIIHPRGFLLQDAFFRIPSPGFLLRASSARFPPPGALPPGFLLQAISSRFLLQYFLLQVSSLIPLIWYILLQESSGPQIACRCLQMFHGCDASQMPPRCLLLNRYTDTQTSSHRVNSAGDHKKQLFGVARRSHMIYS